ncbi:hypothetical protein P4O66_005633 [Electrophorus voltai]|uniref:TIAM Rac1 associated GEF 1b n=1 Tax=Electrophorus voltai TaxID=2609070 RepID=A0AAD8ZLH8_9TELE|nr:hypothetical protein P4O66_005633 [Electrophorus voltai]
MGNVESQNGDHSVRVEVQAHLSRKHVSRSLRMPSKQPRRLHRTSSGKAERHGPEVSARSSSTPSIPHSLAQNGMEALGAVEAPSRATGTRPASLLEHTGGPGSEDSRDTVVEGGEDEETLPQRASEVPEEGGGSLRKKRSKSADMWREDSLEFSLSDLSQEHLTSTEEMGRGGDREDSGYPAASDSHSGERANSLDELCGGFRSSRNRYKYGRDIARTTGGEGNDDLPSPGEEDGCGYGAYTLPCRRSHCLSEGPPSHQGVLCSGLQGRRAQTSHTLSTIMGQVNKSSFDITMTTKRQKSPPQIWIREKEEEQDITAGEGSEYGDSGIDGVAPEAEPASRRCKAMSASFSVYSAASSSVFAGSDSGSSSNGGGAGERAELGRRAAAAAGEQGVYENFRQELELSSRQTRESLEEAGSAASDERSSGTVSSAYRSDALPGVAQGTVRKAGALAVKNFLVHKKSKKVEPATRRKWKRYWVSLKGCTLFFYETDERSGIDHNSIPKHAVWAENSIVQAVPEHPKKDFVFCLSNSLGDAFLFQTSGQTELENWITAIHSACAAAVARQHHRDDTVRFLRSEIKKLEQKIDMDEKMKKMGDMQLTAVTDGKKRKTILEQIFLWEQNLEQFHMDLFRFRCYLSSLQGGELPNPKRLLAFASRPTKVAMGRLGIFSVSSFHALVAARMESGVRRRTQALSRSSSKRKSRFSSLWGLDTTSKKKSKDRPSINQMFVDGEESVKKNLERMLDDQATECSREQRVSVNSLPQTHADSEVWVPHYLTPSWLTLPSDQPVLAIIQPGETTTEALEAVCKAHSLEPSKHYLRVKFQVDSRVQSYIPKPEEELWDLLYKEIEICTKTTKVIQFDRDESSSIGYGFSVAVVDENGTQQLHITHVRTGGLAFIKGLRAGDEILQLNGKAANVLELSDMRAAFSLTSLALTVSSVPERETQQRCPLPPRRSDTPNDLCTDVFSQSQEDILDEAPDLVLKSPDHEGRAALAVNGAVDGTRAEPDGEPTHGSSPCSSASATCMDGGISMSVLWKNRHAKRSSESVYDMLQLSTDQVTAFCRSLHDMNPAEVLPSSSSSSSSSSCVPSPVSPTSAPTAQRQLSDADKLRKVISELVDTERTYVKDLNCLIERYLTPLQKEHFLTQDELDVLFGNLPEMLEFQVEFLKTLEDGTRLVPDLDKLERVDQFKVPLPVEFLDCSSDQLPFVFLYICHHGEFPARCSIPQKVLFSLGGSFLYYADRFKIYSAFCASHTKVPKVLTKAKSDSEFKAFLAERNPRQQHSSTLESYLIKPIQRVLKYPLLLKELYCLTDPDSEEHYHLNVAMKAMNKVASHINEMQKIHEEYGAVFDQLISEQSSDKKEARWLSSPVADLSMGDLLLHTTVAWINPSSFLVKGKKDPELAAFVFRTAVVFVYKDCSKLKKKLGASHRVSVTEERDPFRFRHMISADALQVRTPTNSEGTAVCEIVHVRSESEGRPERKFHLCCSSPDSKKDFLKSVHSVLRDKQRRLLMKTESVPPSRQYIPFGGKRLRALKGAQPTMNRTVSAPSRNPGQRRLVRNRFTIDTDVVFDSVSGQDSFDNRSSQESPLGQQTSPPAEPRQAGGDTDRWVEEQFDLHLFDRQVEVKETDILSDDDEYCESVKGSSAEPSLEESFEALIAEGEEDVDAQEGEAGGGKEEDASRKRAAESGPSCKLDGKPHGPLGLAPLHKQCAVEGSATESEIIWVRRDDFNRLQQ